MVMEVEGSGTSLDLPEVDVECWVLRVVVSGWSGGDVVGGFWVLRGRLKGIGDATHERDICGYVGEMETWGLFCSIVVFWWGSCVVV